MEKPDASRVDIHSLRVVLLIFEYGSLTDAARAMNLSQSSLSYTLARMRAVFSDPLFVQQGRRITPTTGCIALVPRVRALLDEFETLLRPRQFEPETAQRVLRICCNFYERAVLLPEIVKRVRSIGPELRIEVSTADTDGHRMLLDGKADILLSPIVADQSGLMMRALFDEHYVCVMRRDDPRRDHLDLETYRAADHVVVDYDRGWTPFYRQRLKEMGIQIDPVVALPSFGVLRELMDAGRFIVTVPSRVARQFEPECIAVRAPFDAGFSLKLFWPERDHADPYAIWLRQLVADAASTVTSQGSDLLR